MRYHEGEDEFSGDTLQWFAQWTCACGHAVRDYEDEFEFPEKDGES